MEKGTRVGYNYELTLEFNDSAYSIMKKALENVKNGMMNKYLLQRILGNQDQIPPLAGDLKLLEVPTIELNTAQEDAIRACLNQRFVLIQGPPGTGKTSTSAAIAYNIVKQREEQMLVCASSNIAVDNLAEKMFHCHLNVLRVKSKTLERIDLEPVISYTLHYKIRTILDSILTDADATDEEVESYLHVIEKSKSNAELTKKEKLMFATLKAYIEKMLISSADIVCCTCIHALCKKMKKYVFKYLLIDEAAQSKEPEVIVPMMLGAEQVILVGDHKQLKPLVTSTEAKIKGLNRSLFERGINELRCQLHLLNIQYRMHPSIAEFPNNFFYNGTLLNGVTHLNRSGLLGRIPWPNREIPMAFVHINGIEKGRGTSKVNQTEIQYIVQKLLPNLFNHNVDPESIGIICMYKGQRAELTAAIFILANDLFGLEISSVDGFQGKEKELIIISCVRSNEVFDIGFLEDTSRLNVAITRSKSGLIIVGDKQTLSRHIMWSKLMEHFYRRQTVINAHSSSFF